MKALRILKMETGAPSDLSPASQAIWRNVADNNAGRQILLASALRLLDQAEAARQVVEAEGLIKTTATTGTVHLHPAAAFEARCRLQFARIWKQLGLDKETDDF